MKLEEFKMNIEIKKKEKNDDWEDSYDEEEDWEVYDDDDDWEDSDKNNGDFEDY